MCSTNCLHYSCPRRLTQDEVPWGERWVWEKIGNFYCLCNGPMVAIVFPALLSFWLQLSFQTCLRRNKLCFWPIVKVCMSNRNITTCILLCQLFTHWIHSPSPHQPALLLASCAWWVCFRGPQRTSLFGKPGEFQRIDEGEKGIWDWVHLSWGFIGSSPPFLYVLSQFRTQFPKSIAGGRCARSFRATLILRTTQAHTHS